eukprot:m.17399 g.17399  ORF g.17399 m.17399 type:complete len:162 (+) comp7131_c0_seq1:44-529(+)
MTKKDNWEVPTVEYRANYPQFALFALAASAVNIAIYSRILHFDLLDDVIVLAIAAVVSTALLIYGYSNEAKKAFFKIYSANQDHFEKKGKGKTEANVLKGLKAHAKTEANNLSIFYLNSVYLLLTVVTTFYLFHNLSAPTNLLLSTAVSAGVTAFITTGSA